MRVSSTVFLCSAAILAVMGMAQAAFALRLPALPHFPATQHIPVLLDDLKKKLTKEPKQFFIHDEETFKANTKSFHKAPFSDPKLEFTIQLPKDWTADPFTQRAGDSDLALRMLGDVARFKSPVIGTERIVITVKSMRLDREISAESWLKKHIFTNGFTLQDKVTAIDSRKANAAYISTSEGRSGYIYASVYINKNIAMMAQCEIPLTYKDYFEFFQKKSIDSFKLILTMDDSVEIQKTFTLADAVKFTHPQSWQMRYPDFKDPYNMSVQLHNETSAKKVEGMIRVLAIKRSASTSLQKEIDKLKEYFSGFLQIEFKKLLFSQKADAFGRFIFTRYEAYQVGSQKNTTTDQEVRLAILGDKEWYILVFLLSPTETTDLNSWSHNTQVFDLVIKSMR